MTFLVGVTKNSITNTVFEVLRGRGICQGVQVCSQCTFAGSIFAVIIRNEREYFNVVVEWQYIIETKLVLFEGG